MTGMPSSVEWVLGHRLIKRYGDRATIHAPRRLIILRAFYAFTILESAVEAAAPRYRLTRGVCVT